MLLTVSHSTTYRFDTPRYRVVQSHRLTPANQTGQTIRAWTVAVERAAFGAAFTDGAGNLVSTMSLAGPVEDFTVEVTGSVETKDTAGILKGQKETASPEVYLRETRATVPDQALRALAERGGSGRDLDHAHRLAGLVADEIEYETGVTDPAMTASEVVELGKGVCQDMAQVLIALARISGLPARYVTGYMLAGGEDNAGEAGHAWAEIHIEGLGWVGFDPANRCCPDARYIRIGSGLDAAEAAPIRGVSLGPGAEEMDVAVRVEAASQSQQ